MQKAFQKNMPKQFFKRLSKRLEPVVSLEDIS